MKRTSLLLLFLSVAFASVGCNRKPAAPANQQPVAEAQDVLQRQAPVPPKLSVAQQSSNVQQSSVPPQPSVAGEPSAPQQSPVEQQPLPEATAEPPTTPESAEVSAPAEDPLATRIGFLAPLTGLHASFGNDALNGAKLAIDEINNEGGVLDHPIRLIIKDTESQTDKVASAFGELIDTEKVAAVIGEITTDRTLMAAPISQERGIPLITPGATNEKITAVGNYVFRACYTDTFQAAAMAKFAKSLDVKEAAILFDGSNPYGSDLSNAFKTSFQKLGGSIVAEETYRVGDVDYSAQLNAIKLKKPESIFLPSYYPEAALIIKQARQLGMDLLFLGADGWDSSEFLRIGEQAINNCYFASHFSSERLSDTARGFNDSYRAKFQAAPPPLAALAYDSVRLLADALRRAGGTSPTALRDALAATKDFSGVTGTIAFDQNRNPKKAAIILRIQDGRFTYLETVEP